MNDFMSSNNLIETNNFFYCYEELFLVRNSSYITREILSMDLPAQPTKPMILLL